MLTGHHICQSNLVLKDEGVSTDIQFLPHSQQMSRVRIGSINIYGTGSLSSQPPLCSSLFPFQHGQDCKWPRLASEFLWPGPSQQSVLCEDIFLEPLGQTQPPPRSWPCLIFRHPQTFLQHLKGPRWPHSFLLGHLEQLSLVLPLSYFPNTASRLSLGCCFQGSSLFILFLQPCGLGHFTQI